MNTNARLDSGLLGGILLTALGVLLLLSNFQLFGLAHLAGRLVGTLVLGGIGLAFCAVYLARPEHWWPIIPGGVLLTLATITLVGAILPWVGTGVLFHFGLAATFGLVYLAGERNGRPARWALWPAGILSLIGVITLLAGMAKFLFPVALIAFGFYMLKKRGL